MIPTTSTCDANPVLGSDTRDSRVMTHAVARARVGAGRARFSYLRNIFALAHGVLLSFAMVCTSTLAGCVVALPLGPQPQVEDNPPIIVKTPGEATPNFGPITRTRTEAFAFSIAVDDADIEDQLYARLLIGPIENRSSIGDASNVASTGASNNGVRRIADFQELRYCASLTSGPAQVTLWVKVSDAPFAVAGDQTVGKSDEALWVLTCP